MPTSVLAAISKRRDYSQTERLAREWAVLFAELFRVDLAERGTRFVDLWVDALSDLDPGILDAACKQAVRTCKFFPTPAEIRARIEKAEDGALQLEAESAWEKYLEHVRRYFHPDIGWNRRTPGISGMIEHCARAAGGPRWIECCSDSELQWARKRFLDAYLLVDRMGNAQQLLSDREAKKIYESLSAGSETRALFAAARWAEPRR